MTIDHAVRLTEMVLGFALLQQSAEHLSMPGKRRLFAPRAALSLLLMLGVAPLWICIALVMLGLSILQCFQGPYNGGSDRMGILVLCCLCIAEAAPAMRGRELALGYLAMQLALSYVIAGAVKIVNPDWRSGRALQDVFLFSAYPVSEALRGFAQKPRLLWAAGWSVMLFELAFPFCLLSYAALVTALTLAALFHLANACLFGLNRFFWVWIAAYPSLLWLQGRLHL